MSFGMIWCDGFDHYGTLAHMLDGAWSSVAAGGALAIDGTARTGLGYIASGVSSSAGYIRSLGNTYINIYVGFGFRAPSLPLGFSSTVMGVQDNVGNPLATIMLLASGQLQVLNGNGAVLFTTATQVIQTGTWHYVEIHWVKQNLGGDGKIEIQVDAVTVMTQTAVTWSDTNPAAILRFIGNANSPMNLDDVVARDGTITAAFVGDLRVATLFPNADTAVAGFKPRYRKRFGNGILDLSKSNSSISLTAAAADALGSADYTVEGWVRFVSLPIASNKSVIFGQWDEAGNKRSYELYLGGPSLDAGQLCFRISTDGTAATVSQLILWPWVPDLDRWYFVSLCRSAGTTRLFIGNEDDANSILQIAVADAHTYFAAAGGFITWGAENATAANTYLNGFYDEVRFTPAVARYTASFPTPTQAFPRTVGGDPSYNSVRFLAGFDSAIADESPAVRAVTLAGTAAQLTPDDGTGQFTTLNQTAPRDDTFVEASFIAATGTFILNALPANADTVTVGTKAASTPAVYTFKTVLAAAFDVLIGADVQSTINNLAAAIIQGAGAGTTYGTGTTANLDVQSTAEPGGQCLVTALTAGAAGNAIATSKVCANGAWEQGTGATLTGGQDIPGPSEFLFQRLPINTTVIKAIQVVSRSFKTDSGTCDYRVSLVGPSGTVAGGADRSLTVAPAYYNDIFETDPDTAGAITPTTLIAGHVQLKRVT